MPSAVDRHTFHIPAAQPVRTLFRPTHPRQPRPSPHPPPAIAPTATVDDAPVRTSPRAAPAAFPLSSVRLLEGPILADMRRAPRLSALRGPRPAAAHLPPQHRTALVRRALRRLGGAHRHGQTLGKGCCGSGAFRLLWCGDTARTLGNSRTAVALPLAAVGVLEAGPRRWGPGGADVTALASGRPPGGRLGGPGTPASRDHRVQRGGGGSCTPWFRCRPCSTP